MPKLIDDLGELALSSRLLRLSEVTRADVTRIYKENGIGFESKWFPVLYVLSVRSRLSVIEIADEIGYAHPSVIALVREMEKKKWVNSSTSKADGRKRMVSLTPMARGKIIKLQALWRDMRKVAHEVYNNKSSLLRAVEDTEQALQEESYHHRFKRISKT